MSCPNISIGRTNRATTNELKDRRLLIYLFSNLVIQQISTKLQTNSQRFKSVVASSGPVHGVSERSGTTNDATSVLAAPQNLLQMADDFHRKW